MLLAGKDVEQEALETAARLMCAAARTAPKGKGVDNLETLIVVGGEERAKLVAELHRLGEKSGAPLFSRDAGNLEKAGAVVLVGTTGGVMGIPECGFCGFANCAENTEAGGVCAFNPINLGIALGSAVGVAGAHHIDNRIMFTIGKAAINVGLFSGDVIQAFGIPLFVGGKSPFFDR